MIGPIIPCATGNNYPHTDLSEINLDWVLKKIKIIEVDLEKVETELASIKVMTKEEIQDLIDTSIRAYNTVVENLIELKASEVLNNSKNYTDEEIAKIKSYIDTEIIVVLEKSKEYTDQVKIELEDKIDETIIQYSFMINPLTGEEEDVREVLMDVINTFHKSDSLTASEFDAIGITASEFDSLLITAFNFDFYGKTLVIKPS